MSKIDKAQALWQIIYDRFEDSYRNVYLKEEGGVKTKAHIDHFVDSDGSPMIHQPQMKWCLILFMDAIVHVATNSEFNAKSLSCVERRQFNQHKTLRQCITDMQAAMSNGDGIAADELDGRPSDEILIADPVQLTKKVATVTPELFERELSMPPLSKKRDHTDLGTKKILGDQTDSDDEVDVLLLNKRHSSSRDVVPLPRDPPLKKSNKKSDNQSYRAWFDTWGSFSELEKLLGDYAVGGKSSRRHLVIAQSLVRQMAFILASTLHSPSNVVADSSPRYATWTEIFECVLNHPGQRAPVPARAARKSLASIRRQSKAAGGEAAAPILPTIYSVIKVEPGTLPTGAYSVKTEVPTETNVIMDDFFDGFSHAYVPDASFGQDSALAFHQSETSMADLDAVQTSGAGEAIAKIPSMDSLNGFSFFDPLCEDDVDLVQYYFGWIPDDPEIQV